MRISEIHGMAQRGGVVESALIFGDTQGPIDSDGDADVLMGFEPVETLRALGKCNSRSVVITNLAPLMPFTVNIGLGVYPDLEELPGNGGQGPPLIASTPRRSPARPGTCCR